MLHFAQKNVGTCFPTHDTMPLKEMNSLHLVYYSAASTLPWFECLLVPGSGSWVALCRLKDQTLSSQTCTALCLHWNWLTGRDPGAGKDWRGEGDDRGWDGLMASPTRWTWVWANSESWWWTGKPDVPQFMGLQSRTQLSDWTDTYFSPVVFQSFLLYLFILKWSCEYDHNRWCAAHVKSHWTITIFSQTLEDTPSLKKQPLSAGITSHTMVFWFLIVSTLSNALVHREF